MRGDYRCFKLFWDGCVTDFHDPITFAFWRFGSTHLKFMDSLKAFMSKLENWKRKVKIKNVAMFEKLSSILVAGGEDQVIPEFAKNEILQHLTALEKEFSRYFPELSDKELDLV